MAFSDPAAHITTLYVARQCRDLPYAREIIRRSGLPVSLIDDDRCPEFNGGFPGSLKEGKRSLLLTRNRGRFFKPCPGTSEYLCCGYHVLNIGMNCPMDCVYCILQAYLNTPWLSFFVNIEDLFAELDQELRSPSPRLFRIGTGEFTDSLALDRLTGLSRRLIEYVRHTDNAVLELKTKSAVIDNLRDADHGGRTIVAWSLNSPQVAAREELRTASLEQRMAAAARCAEWGYRLAFHFDPVIWHQGWKEGYRHTIRQLFRTVPGDRIVWISLGALRFIPRLKAIAAERFPGSRIFYEEFISGLDGKSRYFRSQRVEMYTFIVNELQRYVSDRTCLYFCMESDAVWREVFGFAPGDRGGLPAMLDDALAGVPGNL
ncbi:MAG: DNA photolyase [Desulfobulbaceae bacterium]|jgi:spore photoproduct lyase|nr:DNA photolyase [Desulfobulbaceae bacterium]MDY0350543.1 DNA photolyase [Desulfobulbaceae bacterium]